MEKLKMRDYYVADNQGNIAGHDLDYAHAQEVLEKQLELDVANSQEWEILQESSE